MPIGEVLEKAFKYPWKNKALWFYGVLLAIFSAGSSMSNQYEVKENDFAFLEKINTNTIIAVTVLAVIIGLFFIILGIIIAAWSQVALCRGAAMLEEGKEISRKEIGKTGKRPVWKIIVLEVFIPFFLILMSLIIIGALIALFYFMPQPLGLYLGIAAAVPAVFAFIAVIIYFSFVWMLAVRFIALSGMNAIDSLKEGMRLLRGKFWWTFLYGVVQAMIGGAASFFAILPLVFLVGAAVFLYIAKIYLIVFVIGILVLLYLAFYIVFLGYFVAFRETGWTIWWLKLKELKKEAPKAKKPRAKKKTAKKS